MGGATSEIDDATTDVLLEMAWFHPIGIVKSSRRHKLRSEASARFEKGTDPEVDRPGHAPLRRPARRAARGRRRRGHRHAARAPAGARPHGPGGAAARHRPRPRLASPRCSTRSASRPRRSATTSTCRSRRGATTRPPRSTSSRRWRGTTATPPSAARCPRAATTGALSPRQADRRRLRRAPRGPGPLRGDADAVPRARRAGSLRPARRRHHDRQPAGRRAVGAAHLAAAGPGRGRRLQLVAPQPRRAAVRDRPHLQPARRRPTPTSPTSGRSSARCWPAPMPPRPCTLWRFVAEALGFTDGDDRERRGARAPPHPQRPHQRGRRACDRRARRDRSRACSTPTASASGWPTSRSTSTRCSPCRTAGPPIGPSACTRAATSTSPSRWTTTCRPPRSRTPSGRPAATCCGACASSTSTAAPAWPTAAAASPTRLRFQAPDRTLTEADVAEARTRIIDAVQSALGATLRG